MEPAFANAGQVEGLEIWRIENFKPVPYPKNEYGKFFTGDSYIVLNTKKRNTKLSWDIHFWLGAETSQDESGTAAILSVKLDEHLGGAPIQYREVQDHESQQFLSYFKSGVRYLPGGIDSGFAHVDPDKFETRLFQVKGVRNIRVRQVDVSVSSMNKGDCFILDAGKEIYVYVGAKSKRMERLKAIAAANQIRDQDHSGRGNITIIDEASPSSEVEEFFEALGDGSPEEVADETAGGDDSQFETKQEGVVSLYRVSDSSGSLKVDLVGQKPLKQSLLDTNDCFILDTADSNIFVWVGKNCTDKEKQESMKIADSFITSKNYPKWTKVQRIVEGAEPTAFSQYFQIWRGAARVRGLTRSVSSADDDDGFKPRLFHASIKGRGKRFQVEEIINFQQKDLFEDDVMLLDVGKELFVWIGHGASVEEKAKSSDLARLHLKRFNRDDVTITPVNQEEEPTSFTSVFPKWNRNFWDDVTSYDDIKSKVNDSNFSNYV